eukprot:TRINITY_DN63902_c0_g1_i1.p1 TRINITY_DN63902_c0_g1~~TRINITY_DN63902_c0_g1_i1.p1  ORF type:complete len:472 (-),score=69.54 TRINITY_DN63902_c0_g1_i1:581-1996(-)
MPRRWESWEQEWKSGSWQENDWYASSWASGSWKRNREDENVWWSDCKRKTTKVPAQKAGSVNDLEVMTWWDFQEHVRQGSQWLIVDGTIIDVAALKDVHKGGLDVLQSRIGLDITGMFRCFHSNLPRTDSLHNPGSTVMEHIREKIAAHAVGILDTHRHWPPLTSSDHRFWVESEEREPYMEMIASSLALQGEDALRITVAAVTGLPPNSSRSRAFWAIVGCLVADAAAQPTQWNYKVPYFHETLRSRDRWEAPEFVKPSLNAWYQVPLGSFSAYGDMTLEVLKSLVDSHRLHPDDIERRFVSKFGEEGDYGPLDGRPGDLPVLGAYRHNSLKSFLKKVYDGFHWPECGTPNAMEFPVRVIPVVALYAGCPDMLDRVADVVRVVQDHPAPVAVGQAFASILESVILHGSSGMDSINSACKELMQIQRGRSGDGMASKVVNAIDAVMDRSDLSLSDAVISLGGGRFCTSQIA